MTDPRTREALSREVDKYLYFLDMRNLQANSLFLDDGLRLGPVLRARRVELGRSRESVARRAHVSTETVIKIERGETMEPGVFTTRALAHAVEWTVDQLLAAVDAVVRPVTPERLTASTGLLSVGYEGRTAAELTDELRRRKVSVVFDIRLTPLSRKPGLSKRALSAGLLEYDIEYSHLPALGNLKDNRAGFSDPSESTARNRYRDRMREPSGVEGVHEIVEKARTNLVALLCFERDEAQCHRSIVVDQIRSTFPEIVLQRA